MNMGKKPSKWRFFVLCKKCNERIDIGDAPSPEEVPVLSSIRIACHHCGTEYTYPGEEVGRVRTGQKWETVSNSKMSLACAKEGVPHPAVSRMRGVLELNPEFASLSMVSVVSPVKGAINMEAAVGIGQVVSP
jgi:hypothetical protein